MIEDLSSQLTFVDWAFIVWMLFSLALGLLRGFILEMLSLIGWILAFFIGFKYGQQIGQLIPIPIKEPTIIFIIGFIIAIIATLIIWAFVKTLLRFAVGHGWIDHTLGLIFGLIRGILISAIAVSLASIMIPLPEQSWWQQSKFHGFLERSANEIKKILPAKWGDRMQIKYDDIKQKIPSKLPAIAEALPSLINNDMKNSILDNAINSLNTNQKNQKPE